MSAGSTGKCQPCEDWICRGPPDDEYSPRRVKVGHDWAAPIREANRQYHGDYYHE